MRLLAGALTAVLLIGSGDLVAADLARLDRTIHKEPAYQSKEPRYCLLVFGPEAETRVWLVLDLPYDPLREKPGAKDCLYADLNRDGDLTQPQERIPVTVVTSKRRDAFTGQEREKHLPQFKVGDVTSANGKTTYSNLVVDVGWYVVGRPDRAVTVSVDVPGLGRQSVGGSEFWFGTSPAKAPVLWFGGALTMRVALSGVVHFPVDYTGKEPPLPWHEEVPLVRGRICMLSVEIGSAGVGFGTFNTITANIPPKDLHPVARIELPHRDAGKPPIVLTAELSQRCCGTLFRSPVDVPEDAAIGKAKVTLSFPAWSAGKVAPATQEVAVADGKGNPQK
jgi:hypothetical protein